MAVTRDYFELGASNSANMEGAYLDGWAHGKRSHIGDLPVIVITDNISA
jgi:hypothetical protein